jgi:hypothetical protein
MPPDRAEGFLGFDVFRQTAWSRNIFVDLNEEKPIEWLVLQPIR